ncbi:MAG: glucokinase [Rhodanobacter sp.]
MDATTTHPDLPTHVPETPFLATVVGVLFARVGRLRTSHDEGRDVEVRAHQKLACAKFEGLAEPWQWFVEGGALSRVRHCVLACAGHVEGDVVLGDNSSWLIHLAQLRQTDDAGRRCRPEFARAQRLRRAISAPRQRARISFAGSGVGYGIRAQRCAWSGSVVSQAWRAPGARQASSKR